MANEALALKPFRAITVFAWSLAAAVCFGQSQSLVVVSRARLDFEKVDAQPRPTLIDTDSCAQSNAAAMAVARPEERYIFYYRKGYCELFSAVLTGNSESFQAAAKDFTETIANWPKKFPTRPPAGLRALMSIARVEQGRMADSYPDILKDLGSVIADTDCPPTPVMSKFFCAALVDTARTWLGWLAYRRNEFDQAALLLQPIPSSPWGMWIAGRLAQDHKRLDEAGALYQRTLDAWSAAEKSANPDVVSLLGPKLDAGAVQYQLGLLEFTRQRYDAAINRFDATVKASPKNSYAIFLRARSKEALRLTQAALSDYALAAQTARAGGDTSWSVGQAHFYRGMLLYGVKDYARAEGEFGNALSTRLTDIAPADVTAWRALSAVAGGACKSSDALESAARAASSQFPKEQADALVFECRTNQAITLEQSLALEKVYSAKLDAAKLRRLHDRIAGFYADIGVAAEERKDPYSAVIAYRTAIGWNPANAKARFNLGAIYIEDKRFTLAETEYRALVEADHSDYEAHYWLAQSILAQRPGPERVTEACGLLQRSLTIEDAEKKAQFAKAIASAKCSP